MLLLAFVALVAAACGIIPEPRPPEHSIIVTGADGLRTFTIVRSIEGTSVLCTLSAAIPALQGRFRGDPTNRVEPAWLEGPGGRRLSVVWPQGFRLMFEPPAVLRNEKGGVVAREGVVVELPQVHPDDAAGTFDDPYIAAGLMFGECYPFIR